MKNKYSPFQTVLLLSGSLLLLGAVVLLIFSLSTSAKFEVDCDKTAVYLESVLPARTSGIKEERSNNIMPAIAHDGQDYSALFLRSRQRKKGKGAWLLKSAII